MAPRGELRAFSGSPVISVCVYVCVRVCVCVCMYVFMCLCVCLNNYVTAKFEYFRQ